MKKLMLILLMSMVVFLTFAQTITIEKSYKAFEQKGFHPQFSPAGDKLAFSSESYGGLFVYDLTDRSTVKVTDEPGAGFQPVFSPKGEKLFYKTVVYESRLRKEGVRSFDLANGKQNELLAPRRNTKRPQAYGNGVLVYAENKLLKATVGKTKAPVSDYVWSDGSNLNIFRNNRIEKLNPIEGANGYIWTSLSPNGKMILFTAAAQGTFICNLDGKVIANLGYLNAPTWFDDNFVVGMQDKDNGEYVTESTILMKSIDGKVEKVLSDKEHIAMYPTAAANKVAYCTTGGNIYLVELKIKK